MAAYGLPVLFTVFVWWFSTGIILYLVGLPRSTFRWSMAGASGVLGGALIGLAQTGYDTSVAGHYLAFMCAVLVADNHADQHERIERKNTCIRDC